MASRILYTCYNNKGRSPTLKAFTDYFLGKKGIIGVETESAGVGVESILSLRARGSTGPSRVAAHIMLRGYDIDIEDVQIKHLGELEMAYDFVLAADLHTMAITFDKFPEFAVRTMLAGDFAGHSSRLEIKGPYYYQKKFSEDRWSELLGYEIMLNETKNVARRIVKKIVNSREY